jgi:agmatine/peptidylarginine deiminase
MKSFVFFISFLAAVTYSAPSFAGLEDIPANLKPIPEWSSKSAVVLTTGTVNSDFEGPFNNEWLNFIKLLATKADIRVVIYTPNKISSETLRKKLGNYESVRILQNEDHSTKWVRDFAPFWLRDLNTGNYRLLDLPYPRPEKDDDFPVKFAEDLNLNRIDPKFGVSFQSWHLAGGNFQSDSESTCFMTNLGNVRQGERYRELAGKLGCQTSLILEALLGEPTGHVDMFFMALPNKTALVSEYLSPDDRTIQTAMERNYEVLTQQGYRLIKVPTVRQGILHFSYTNSVILGGTAFVPQYGVSTDSEAILIFERAGFSAIPVPAAELIRLHGSLHCLTTYIFK